MFKEAWPLLTVEYSDCHIYHFQTQLVTVLVLWKIILFKLKLTLFQMQQATLCRILDNVINWLMGSNWPCPK